MDKKDDLTPGEVTSALDKIYGKWPGDESDEEIAVALKDLSESERLPKMSQFQNPTPVNVVLIGVYWFEGHTQRTGLIGIRRGEDPGKGQLALPGGYLEIEDVREGAVREVREELGIELEPESLKVFSVKSTPDKHRLLVFWKTPFLRLVDLSEPFIPNKEVMERVIIQKPMKMAFSTHEEVVREWFGQ